MPRHSPDRNEAPSVRFDQLRLSYDNHHDVLSDLTFELEQGSFTFLTGASGAGKTTLLRLIYLALQPSAGEVYLFGQRTSRGSRSQLAALRRKIGVVFQDFRLLDHLTAYENVALPLRVQGRREPDYREDVEDLLEWVGLGARMHARPETLSGGEQQRVAIARALVGKPDLLIADEPTGNVDPEMGTRLMRLFVEMNKRLGASVLIATHDHGLIERSGAPVIRLENGLLVKAGSKGSTP